MMNTKKFTVQTDDDISICCYLDKHPSPIIPGLVVLIHGRMDTANQGPLCNLPSRERFYDTLRIDMRGMGESGGTTTYDNACVEGKDVSKVLSCLSEHYTGPVLAIVGHSQGSSTMFFQAIGSPDNSPPLLINVSGRFDAKGTEGRFPPKIRESLKEKPYPWMSYLRGPSGDMKKEIYWVSLGTLTSYESLVMDCVSTLESRFKILNIHGRADGTVRCDNAIKYDEAVRRGEASSDLILVDGVKHGWDSDQEIDLLGDLIAGWIRRRSEMNVKRVPESDLIDTLVISHDS